MPDSKGPLISSVAENPELEAQFPGKYIPGSAGNAETDNTGNAGANLGAMDGEALRAKLGGAKGAAIGGWL